jgi:hypothetical protein
MSCSFAKGAWEVRWRDSAGRQRFKDEAAAQAFDAAIRDQATVERQRTRHGQAAGVYPYKDRSRGPVAVCDASLRRDDDEQAWLLKRDRCPERQETDGRADRPQGGRPHPADVR